MKYKALTSLLSLKHSVVVVSEWALRQWIQREARSVVHRRAVSSHKKVEPYEEKPRSGKAAGAEVIETLEGLEA